MGNENSPRAVIPQVLDCRQGGFNAAVISNPSALILWDIEVDADENALALNINVFDGLFVHKPLPAMNEMRSPTRQA
jgi:hypothetical protein